MALLRKLFGSLFLLAASVAPALAQSEAPWPGAHWYLQKTDQGCYYYDATTASPKEEARQRRTWYFSITWEGGCTPGKLINGLGTMVEVGDLSATTNHAGRSINRRKGTMVNGLWDGDMVHSDAYPGMDPNTYPPIHFTMGCVPGMAGDKTNSCRPPIPPPALIETPR